MYLNDLEYMGCIFKVIRIIRRTRKYRKIECEVNFYGKVIKGSARMYKNGRARFVPDNSRDVIFLREAYKNCLEREGQPLTRRAIYRFLLLCAANMLTVLWLYLLLGYGYGVYYTRYNGHISIAGYYYIIQIILSTAFQVISVKMRDLIMWI